MEVCAAVFVGRCTDNKLVIHYERGHMLHNVVYDLCAENGRGLPGKELVSLRLQNKTLCGDAGAGGEIFLS